jgi:dienelactone hydrolase
MSQPSSPAEAAAKALIEDLARGAWEHPRTPFTPALADALPPAKLRSTWEALEQAAGEFRGIEGTTRPRDSEGAEGIQVALVISRFDRVRKQWRVALDANNRVAGLFWGPVPEDVEARTRSLISAASRGDFELASRDFGSVMKRALSPAKFGETWQAVEQKVGPWRSIERLDLKREQGFWVSLATSRFEHGRLVVRVVYDARNEIAGLFFQDPPVAWSAPPYANRQAFEERPVTVGTAPALSGTLTVPKGTGPFPAVVLVHGSGPNDQDESVGAVKVFKDLAWGLASNGIAVLRYTKRSRQSPGIATQKEEVLDAAHDAVELLRHTDGIDASRIFLVGHSQGGGLAPRIAKGNPSLAGIVVLAGNTRSLQDSLMDQFTYFASLHPENTELAAKVDAVRRFKQVVEDPALRADQDVEVPTGGSVKGAYFLDARGYDAPSVAETLSCKMFILQGDRDYQVTMKDFDGWKRALAHKDGALLRIYPSLNHLFVSGAGTPSPSEYERPGHVDGTVVHDIAAWISATTS